jgi:hypothetical protein
MRSSRELVALAERALRTGQPNLARLYMGAAENAQARERAEAAMAVEVAAAAVSEAEAFVAGLAVVMAPLYGRAAA